MSVKGEKWKDKIQNSKQTNRPVISKMNARAGRNLHDYIKQYYYIKHRCPGKQLNNWQPTKDVENTQKFENLE